MLVDYYEYWIGATDLTRDGEFRYINSGVKVKEEHWDAGQPDNGDEHCVFMWWWGSGVWLHDYPCSRKHYFVCEKP